MQVLIENNCFVNVSNYRELDSIFLLFVEGRHQWIDIDLEEIEKTEWFRDLGKRNIDDLKSLFVSSTRKSRLKKTIKVINDISEEEFNVLEARFYLYQPLTIIVENYEYEPVFLNCIFKNFGNDLIEAKNKHWLKFESSGGANDNTVKGMLKELFNDSIFSKGKEEKHLRCYVIKDSDRKYCTLDDDGKVIPQKIEENKINFLEEKNIPYHILYKREKENYMPDTIFNSFFHRPRMKEFMKVYFKLSVHQKDFFDLEKGFSSKGVVKKIEELDSKVKELYKDLSEDDYETIGRGIDYSNFKSSFSDNFENCKKNDLEKRIEHQPLLSSEVNPSDKTLRNEFEHIIHEIKYLL